MTTGQMSAGKMTDGQITDGQMQLVSCNQLYGSASKVRLKIWPLPFHSHIILFWYEFFCSIHISFCSGLIFFVKIKNGQDYWS
jgi:hypothetical protein